MSFSKYTKLKGRSLTCKSIVQQNPPTTSADARLRQPKRLQDPGGSKRSTREEPDRPPLPAGNNVDGMRRRAARPTPRGDDHGSAASLATADEVPSSRPHRSEYVRRESGAQPTTTVSQSERNTSAPRASGSNLPAQDAAGGGGSSNATDRMVLPTDSTESAPLIGMDVNTNPLAAVSENVQTGLYAPDAYGNESDHHELHAKARDLGLR